MTVVTTYAAAAFDGQGDYTNASGAIFTTIANELAPNSVMKLPS